MASFSDKGWELYEWLLVALGPQKLLDEIMAYLPNDVAEPMMKDIHDLWVEEGCIVYDCE